MTLPAEKGCWQKMRRRIFSPVGRTPVSIGFLVCASSGRRMARMAETTDHGQWGR